MTAGDDRTLTQGPTEQHRSQALSQERVQPPTALPGYEFERFLGSGAFGEVWVARERNTGRRVAVKFYSHRGGLDWSLLAREVEKLALLFADRYVVQLIGVGWDASPPYYIMEYLEQGSLAEQLQRRGTIPVEEAVALFREVAIGLTHAHGKGVLHCDLKPANVLLDQDEKPRLADFGQSRLSCDQTPALGTLFFMAPEQADLKAVPDARWDVYALGALLYCMVVGRPPHRTDASTERIDQAADLPDRLNRYAETIRGAPAPTEHRTVRGMDSELAEIIDRCLAPEPESRFPNAQAVLDALASRSARRARRPLLVLGAIGPLAVSAVVALFAWWGFGAAWRQSEETLTERALESNRFAAQYVARHAATEIEARLRAVERVADSSRFWKMMEELTTDPTIEQSLVKLNDPKLSPMEESKLQLAFRDHPRRVAFQRAFEEWIGDRAKSVNSWFVMDARGVQLARMHESRIPTIGRNFAWRAYFNGLGRDMPETWRPDPKQHISDTIISPVYFSRATHTWMAAICAPVYDEADPPAFAGIVGITIEVGRFLELQGGERQFATLVDWRDGETKGMILQHPLWDTLRNEKGQLPERLTEYRVSADRMPKPGTPIQNYVDPVGNDPDGAAYRKRWLAQSEPVQVRGDSTGWVVLVQESYDATIGGPLDDLRRELLQYALMAAAAVILVAAGAWTMALRR